jgi:hypothetical protein
MATLMNWPMKECGEDAEWRQPLDGEEMKQMKEESRQEMLGHHHNPPFDRSALK